MIGATACSGMGAPETAMPHWQWSLASEIEAAPRAVLAYRHGAEDARRARRRSGPALWGDFTAIRVRHFARLGVPVPEWLVAGTPCQSFSFAGLRGGLSDARGNLTLEFLRLVHALRRSGSLRGFLWENVPGILSHAENPFGCFLSGIVGADAPLRSPLKRGRWPGAGMVDGPLGRAAWRVQDAQFHGLAQRRERVFVVASFVDGIDPGAVLLECCSLQGFPDHFSAIPYRKRKLAADDAELARIEGARVWTDETGQHFADCMADGPRYKMLGNSMAVPVIRWILQRVEAQVAHRD